jgi:HK97 family phage major capsid protein
MAITAASKTSDFSGFLPRRIAQPYFEIARRNSVVQQLAREVPLGITGESVPVTTQRPTANWVAEGAQKPATKGAMSLKNMDPKKIAAIAVVSEEVVRANPGGYMDELRNDIGEAFAIAFDLATLHNLGGDGTGTGPFSTFIDQTTKSVELGGSSQGVGGVYKDLVDAVGEVITDTDSSGIRHYRVNGIALDSTQEVRLREAVDTTGRPLWTDLPTGQEPAALMQSGSLLNRRAFMGDGVANVASTIVGYVGDWTQVVWGTIGGINYSVSNQATVTINGSLVSLWENNLVAIRAEAEFGFLVNDPDAFCQLRNDSGS